MAMIRRILRSGPRPQRRRQFGAAAAMIIGAISFAFSLTLLPFSASAQPLMQLEESGMRLAVREESAGLVIDLESTSAAPIPSRLDPSVFLIGKPKRLVIEFPVVYRNMYRDLDPNHPWLSRVEVRSQGVRSQLMLTLTTFDATEFHVVRDPDNRRCTIVLYFPRGPVNAAQKGVEGAPLVGPVLAPPQAATVIRPIPSTQRARPLTPTVAAIERTRPAISTSQPREDPPLFDDPQPEPPPQRAPEKTSDTRITSQRPIASTNGRNGGRNEAVGAPESTALKNGRANGTVDQSALSPKGSSATAGHLPSTAPVFEAGTGATADSMGQMIDRKLPPLENPPLENPRTESPSSETQTVQIFSDRSERDSERASDGALERVSEQRGRDAEVSSRVSTRPFIVAQNSPSQSISEMGQRMRTMEIQLMGLAALTCISLISALLIMRSKREFREQTPRVASAPTEGRETAPNARTRPSENIASCYRLLGVPPNATESEIRARYTQMIDQLKKAGVESPSPLHFTVNEEKISIVRTAYQKICLQRQMPYEE